MRVDIPAGSVLYREDDSPRCGLLISGLELNTGREIIQPDGTRIVTLPNGATRVYTPGTQPRRTRIPN